MTTGETSNSWHSLSESLMLLGVCLDFTAADSTEKSPPVSDSPSFSSSEMCSSFETFYEKNSSLLLLFKKLSCNKINISSKKIFFPTISFSKPA